MSATVPVPGRMVEPDERRLAVVSGGGTGIGRAIAEALRADGDDVLVLGRRAEVVAAAAEDMNAVAADGFGTASWLAADLAEPRDVRRVGHVIGAQGRKVGVIVANAGAPASRVEGDLEQVAAAWNSAFRANVLTAVLLVHALEPMLSGTLRWWLGRRWAGRRRLERSLRSCAQCQLLKRPISPGKS